MILLAVLSLSLVACGGDKSTSADNTNTETEENGSVTSQTTEKDLVNKDLTYSDLVNMTVDEMKQYYNADELIGTPTIKMNYVSSKGKGAETFRVSREIYDDNGTITFEKEYYIENTIGLGECLCPCYCIFVDNNTPDDYEDDQFAFVFYWVYH